MCSHADSASLVVLLCIKAERDVHAGDGEGELVTLTDINFKQAFHKLCLLDFFCSSLYYYMVFYLCLTITIIAQTQCIPPHHKRHCKIILRFYSTTYSLESWTICWIMLTKGPHRCHVGMPSMLCNVGSTCTTLPACQADSSCCQIKTHLYSSP